MIADGLSLDRRVILDRKLPQTRLLRLHQCQQVLCRCLHFSVLLGLDRNDLFLKPSLAGRRSRFGFQMVNGQRYLTPDSEFLRQQILENLVCVGNPLFCQSR